MAKVEIMTSDVTRDPTLLSSVSRRFHDPADRKMRSTFIFHVTSPDEQLMSSNRLRNFAIEWIRRGLFRPKQMKALTFQSDQVKYFTNQSSRERKTHGHALTIYEKIMLLPIDQSLPIGTSFTIDCDNEEGDYAITLLTGHMIRIDTKGGSTSPREARSAMPTNDEQLKVGGRIPFNRRTSLIHLLPSESISAKCTVQYVGSLSLREADWIGRPVPESLVVYTRLGRSSTALVSDCIDMLLEDIDKDDTVKRVHNMGWDEAIVIPILVAIGKEVKRACSADRHLSLSARRDASREK